MKSIFDEKRSSESHRSIKF